MRTAGRALALLVTLAAAPASAGVNRWTSTGPEGGSIDDLAVDPAASGTVYATAPGTLFRSTDGGGSWTRLELPEPCYVGRYQVVVEADGRVDVAACRILRSSDGGATWTSTSPLPSVQGAASVGIEPGAPDTLYAGTGNQWLVAEPGFFKSTDGGATWTPLPVAELVVQIVVDPSSPARVYAATRTNGIMVSPDRGTTWSVGKGTEHRDFYAVAADRTHAGHAYAAGIAGLFVTQDGGASWTAVEGAPAIDVVATDTGAWGIGGIFAYRTTDGGAHWDTAPALPDDEVGFGFGSGQVLAATNGPDPTLYVSGLGEGVTAGRFGETFARRNAGLVASEVYGLGVDPVSGLVFAGVLFGGGWRSADGVAWERIPVPTFYPAEWSFTPGHPSTVWASGLATVARSEDLGATWSPDPVVGTEALGALAAHPTIHGTADVADRHLYRTTNGGASWERIDYDGFPTGGARGLLIDPLEPTTLHFDAWDGGATSVDGGIHWTRHTPVGPSYWRGELALAPGAPTRLLATGLGSDSRAHLFSSTDGGASWTAGPQCPMDLHQLAPSPVDPLRLYAAGYNDVFTTRDGGAHWYRLGRGTRADVFVRDIAADPLRANVVHAALGASGASSWEDRCGDAVPDAFEECDDGNSAPGDGCRAECAVERGGDGVVDPSEECDDGNLVDGDGCDSNQTVTRCGNGVRTGAEECDDGNADDTDRCGLDCHIRCAADADCDDGDACVEDQCFSSTCYHAPAWRQPRAAACGVRALVASDVCAPSGIPAGFAVRLDRAAGRVDALAGEPLPGARRKAVRVLRRLAARAQRSDDLGRRCGRRVARSLRATAAIIRDRWRRAEPRLRLGSGWDASMSRP